MSIDVSYKELNQRATTPLRIALAKFHKRFTISRCNLISWAEAIERERKRYKANPTSQIFALCVGQIMLLAFEAAH
jgi:hypothetical protein